MFIDPNHKIAHFIDGSVSGFFASLLIQPLQVIKTAMMVRPVSQNKIQDKNNIKKKNLSMLEATRVIFRS